MEKRMTWVDPRVLLALLAGMFALLALVAQFRQRARLKSGRGFWVQPAAKAFGLLALVFGLISAWLRWHT
jgi:hypothetical protein